MGTYTSVEPDHNLIRRLWVLRREKPEVQLLLRRVSLGPSRIREGPGPVYGKHSPIGLSYVKGDIGKGCSVYEILWAGCQ